MYDDDEKHFEDSFFGIMRRYFIQSALDKNYHVIDMKPVFSKDFARHGERFETPRDAHWNERGHRVVAERLFEHFGGIIP